MKERAEILTCTQEVSHRPRYDFDSSGSSSTSVNEVDEESNQYTKGDLKLSGPGRSISPQHKTKTPRVEPAAEVVVKGRPSGVSDGPRLR